METAAKKEISVHIAKNHMVIDCSIQSTITATVLGLVAQIEREFISSRTKDALAKRMLKLIYFLATKLSFFSIYIVAGKPSCDKMFLICI